MQKQNRSSTPLLFAMYCYNFTKMLRKAQSCLIMFVTLPTCWCKWLFSKSGEDPFLCPVPALAIHHHTQHQISNLKHSCNVSVPVEWSLWSNHPGMCRRSDLTESLQPGAKYKYLNIQIKISKSLYMYHRGMCRMSDFIESLCSQAPNMNIWIFKYH